MHSRYRKTSVWCCIVGYRIDAAKHMWPGDISGVLALTRGSNYGTPYVFQEVIDLYGSEPIKSTDYLHIGAVTEFKYGETNINVFAN